MDRNYDDWDKLELQKERWRIQEAVSELRKRTHTLEEELNKILRSLERK